MGRKDAEPDAYNCRIFRFCAGWLKRMQAIAEAAWLLQSNRWPFGIFGPRYFSTKSFDARGGGPVQHGGGGGISRGRVSGSTREIRALLLHIAYLSTTPLMPEGRATSRGPTFPPPAICGCDGS